MEGARRGRHELQEEVTRLRKELRLAGRPIEGLQLADREERLPIAVKSQEDLQEEVARPRELHNEVAVSKVELLLGSRPRDAQLLKGIQGVVDRAREKHRETVQLVDFKKEQQQSDEGESDEDQVEVVMVKKKPKGDYEKILIGKDNEIQPCLNWSKKSPYW